ncbi:MAG: acyltransferase domain-containing protein [Planctomycetes bacterium]|nr:acyltransferase domain-containing protein [Planctomycetota bacterium]
MSKRAIVFPGQGAQHPGMAADIIAAVPRAAALLDRANEVLGFDLKSLCLQGPAERLEATDVCQPAIFATSAAVIEALRAERGLRTEDFSATAGLSLGEYTALWFAGALALDDALRLVRRRGEAMQRASEENPSGMISLLGATRAQAADLARAAAPAGVLVTANYLAPGSIALSGAKAALDVAEARAREFDIRRTVRLKVAGAFHSPLMASATQALRAALAEVEIRPPCIAFAANVTGERVSDPEAIRRHLADQVTSPVLWEETQRGFVALGVDVFVEPAPGGVLTGLLRKTAPQARGVNVTSLQDVQDYA